MSACIPPILRLDLVLPGEGTKALFVILDHQQVVATVQLTVGGARVASFARLFVHPAHRQRGLGRALLSAVERAARAAGSEAIACEVHAKNLAAQAFYRRCGFSLGYQFEDGGLLMHRQTLKEDA